MPRYAVSCCCHSSSLTPPPPPPLLLQTPAIGFIAADVRGAAGWAFVDFGPQHMVRDPNGEQVG